MRTFPGTLKKVEAEAPEGAPRFSISCHEDVSDSTRGVVDLLLRRMAGLFDFVARLAGLLLRPLGGLPGCFTGLVSGVLHGIAGGLACILDLVFDAIRHR